VFDSSGPEGKVRGTPQQIIDKYNQFARDAQLSNDRVAAENFQQHAEHYLRLLSEALREQNARREEQERQNRERQAERGRERAERQQREADAKATEDLGSEPKPDVLELSDAPATEDESILVETPEGTAPKKPRQSRFRKTPPPEASQPEVAAAPAETVAEDAPDTASEPEAGKEPLQEAAE